MTRFLQAFLITLYSSQPEDHAFAPLSASHRLIQQRGIFFRVLMEKLTVAHSGEYTLRHRGKVCFEQRGAFLWIDLLGAAPEFHLG